MAVLVPPRGGSWLPRGRGAVAGAGTQLHGPFLLPALCLQRLGAEALVRLEHQLVSSGKSSVLELLQVGGRYSAKLFPLLSLPLSGWPLSQALVVWLCANPRRCTMPWLRPRPLQAVESWERQALRYGQAKLGALEGALAGIGSHNLQVPLVFCGR